MARLATSFAVIGMALGGAAASHNWLSARAADPATLQESAPQIVSAGELRIVQDIVLERRFTGQFEPQQSVALAFEEGGTISDVLVQEGEEVARGEVIARLDIRLLEAESARLASARAALAARVELAQRTQQRQEALGAAGHVAQQRVDEASLLLTQLEATLAETGAAIAAVEVRLSKSEIRAPFAGRIGARLLDAGAVAAPGAGVVSLLEKAPPRFRVGIDPRLASQLESGLPVEIETAEGIVPARFAELSPELDPATRARLAFFDLVPGAAAPPARTSGTLRIRDRQPDQGAWVPFSALRQGSRGNWTILTLDPVSAQSALVELEAVEILHVEGSRAFVRGGFDDGTRFVDQGTHRVVPGQTVQVTGVRL